MTIPRYVLNASGEPIAETNPLKWARWFQTADREVARDGHGNVNVSTVFLGLDHSFGAGPPVLWETMIFGGAHDEYQKRYTSRVDALTGHARAVALAFGKKKRKP